MINKLKVEICRRIFTNFGICIDDGNRNDLICCDKNRCSSLFTNDGTIDVEKACWAGSLNLSDTEMHVLITDISDNPNSEDAYFEYAAVFRYGTLPVYGVRLSSDQEDDGDFLVRLETGNWITCTTFLQTTALSGIERISEFQPGWKRLEDSESMFNYLIEFLKLGD